jgi:hypothetical protein
MVKGVRTLQQTKGKGIAARGNPAQSPPFSLNLTPSPCFPPSMVAPTAGTQMVMPGDNFQATVELALPVAMEVGVRFAIRDSGRTVGAGVVTKLIK